MKPCVYFYHDYYQSFELLKFVPILDTDFLVIQNCVFIYFVSLFT